MNLEEKRFRLKYLYFIDCDEILSKIKESNAYLSYQSASTKDPTHVSDEKIENLFCLIFDEMLSASLRYTSYAFGNVFTGHCFFGENCSDGHLEYIKAHMAVSLFHHCLIQSYHALLVSNSTDRIQITEKNDYIIKSGFIKPVSIQKLDEPTNTKTTVQKDNIPQRDFSRNNHLNSQKTSYYSTCMLNVLRKKEAGKYFSQTYSALFSYFCWRSIASHQFNKALLTHVSPSTFIGKYQALYNDYVSWGQPLSKPDSLLLTYYMEKAYNFDFMAYAGMLLDKIHHTDRSDTFSLKDLEGESFVTVLQQACNLPMPFNKTIFLYYACEAIESTENFIRAYPPHPQKGMTYISGAVQNNVIKASEAFRLLNDYFHMLAYVTIPIIEDMWCVLTSPNLLGIELDATAYGRYIETHYAFITTDYVEICRPNQINNSRFTQTFDQMYKRLYRQYSREHLQEKTSRFTRNYTIYSASLKKSLQEILLHYCTSKRAEYIDDTYAPDNHLQSHLSTAVTSDQELFLGTHLESIYNFIRTI